MRVVLDTNILISALFWEGNERNVLKKCKAKRYHLILSPQILSELENVLDIKFKVPMRKITDYSRDIILFSEIVIPKGEIDVIKEDPTDNMILETAYLGKADVIITGDKHLLKLKKFKKIEIKKAVDI